jgi:uncharacterized protein YwgA
MTKERLKWFCREILGREPNLDSFEDKLIIQKTGYIAQIMGIGWNYDYGWYVRGVYSSKLTVDLYDQKGKDAQYEPTEKDREIAGKIKSLKNSLSGMETYSKEADSYELASTIVWVKAYKKIAEEKAIADYVKEVKPWYTKEHIERAMSYVDGLGST